MRVALLQFDPAYLDVAANLDRVEELLGDVEADLFVLPELFTSGYFFRSTDDARSAAEPVPAGSTTRRMARWSLERDAVFVGGLPEQDGDRLFNSAVVTDPDGFVGVYRKSHLYYQEKLHFEAGDDGFPVYSVRDGQGRSYGLGVMICFDWFFPESARTLALAGADVIVHPSNLVRKNCPRAMPIRALENHCFTVTANRVGSETSGEQTLTFIGQSLVCSPEGHTLVQANRAEETVLLAELDPVEARDRHLTEHNEVFDDRRADVYGL